MENALFIDTKGRIIKLVVTESGKIFRFDFSGTFEPTDPPQLERKTTVLESDQSQRRMCSKEYP